MVGTRRDFITERVSRLPASPTIAVANEVNALLARGVDVVDFGPGEPDFDSPADATEAAIEALRSGRTHYAPSRGISELRTAIAGKLSRENGLRYDPEREIVVTPGAKQAVLEAVVVTVGSGDEVIIFEPAWGTYSAIVTLAGGTAVPVQLTDEFTIDPERLNAALSERTRAIIVGTPHNPTGHVLNKAELDLLADVCTRYDLVLISDEIYERITYDGIEAVSPATMPGMWERTVTINGLSKAYAMTGWRLGYAAASAPIIAAMLKIQEHSVTAATTFAQVGAVAALDGPQEPVRSMVAEFARRRSVILDGLNRLPGFRASAPEGTFYVFPDIRGTGMSGTELARVLLRGGIAVTPGAGFGLGWDTHIRLSYALSEERIRDGLRRMKEILS